MKWYFFPVRWIPIQVDRFLDTNKPSRYIYPVYVRNQNWISIKASSQSAESDRQTCQSGNRNSLFHTSHLARKSPTQRSSEGSETCRLFRNHSQSTSFRSTRSSARGAQWSDSIQGQRFFQGSF